MAEYPVFAAGVIYYAKFSEWRTLELRLDQHGMQWYGQIIGPRAASIGLLDCVGDEHLERAKEEIYRKAKEQLNLPSSEESIRPFASLEWCFLKPCPD